ncbi:MAG: M48 family metalloprotease [Candidatus Binatia bacterium]
MRVNARAAAWMLVLLAGTATGASALTTAGERELGQQFDLEARKRVALVDDPDVVAYVNELGGRIVAQLQQPHFAYQFAVVRDARMNAFAVPGGYVYVHSGLLATAQSEDEIAGVLGHEIAHVHAHHLARQQERTQLLNYAVLAGTLLSIIQPAAGALASAAGQTVALQYKREFEQEADYLGARYMRAAGYDPRALLDFFKRLSDQQRNAPTSVPAYAQTHPLTDERLNQLEAVLNTQQWAARERAPVSLALQRVRALVRVRGEPASDVQAAYARERDARPNDPMAAYLVGLVDLETGRVDDAERALLAAREGGVQDADRELGRLALRRRDAARARELLTAHLDKKPADAAALIELATADEALGDRHGALSAYRRALDLAPGLAVAHISYGRLAGRLGRDGEGFYHLATASRLEGNCEGALRQYTRAEPLLPAGDARREDAAEWITTLRAYLGLPERADPSEEP